MIFYTYAKHAEGFAPLPTALVHFQVMKISEVSSHFPYFASGLVVKGFGRGSKELGIPTGMNNQYIIRVSCSINVLLYVILSWDRVQIFPY